MVIYFSGEGTKAAPESVLLDDATVMLTYHNMRDGPDKRFQRILDARRAGKPKKKRPRTGGKP